MIWTIEKPTRGTNGACVKTVRLKTFVMRSVLIVTLIVLSHLDTSAALAGRVEDRESLRRLPGVEVIVETFLQKKKLLAFHVIRFAQASNWFFSLME